MTLSRSISSDRTLFEVVEYARFIGCQVYEYEDASARFHVAGSFHDARATDPRFRGKRQAADINHDGAGDAAEYAFLRDRLYTYAAITRGLAVTFPEDTEGHGVAGHSIGDGLHMHLDRGEWSNIGHGAVKLPSTGHDKGLTEAQVKDVQRWAGVAADGLYGRDTLAAVAKRQRQLGVPADGLYGPQTAAARKAGVKPEPKFPLAKGHAYAIDDHTEFTHSGARKGDRDEIKRIQRKVGVTADGIYGTRTRHAVQAWQRRRGLKGDGQVGPATWHKMF